MIFLKLILIFKENTRKLSISNVEFKDENLLFIKYMEPVPCQIYLTTRGRETIETYPRHGLSSFIRPDSIVDLCRWIGTAGRESCMNITVLPQLLIIHFRDPSTGNDSCPFEELHPHNTLSHIGLK